MKPANSSIHLSRLGGVTDEDTRILCCQLWREVRQIGHTDGLSGTRVRACSCFEDPLHHGDADSWLIRSCEMAYTNGQYLPQNTKNDQQHNTSYKSAERLK